jgi:hypothetical protein
MRPRTPKLLWIPFVFSVAGMSWMLLLASLAVLAAVIFVPALQDTRAAEADRNNVQATLELLDQKLALQDQFIKVALKDPLVMERLAGRQLRLVRADQQVLILDPAELHQDHSITSLLSESLQPVTPKPIATLPAPIEKCLQPLTNPNVRRFATLLACAGLLLAFLLGVRFEKAPIR